ncbi:MAG TPA: tetratricopeptide repeat protein [Noviherbaspirillum sp.]|jgi:predicted O-linked N-acetylglucosamine transferase (SPINDLY family)|uniref:O-linked N-acetylglucosamine transferase family protein n=1 Tax=Noviherbaspirillum sp. TaxID=1926288 RepID=UPI002F92492B
MMKPKRSLLSPLTSRSWLLLGTWLERKGLSGLAETCYRNLIATDADGSAQASLRLAQSLLEDQRFRDAAAICEQGLKVSPRDARLWCALGAARRQSADMPGARQAYEQAIACDDKFAAAWSNLGEWHLAANDAPAALAALDRALQIDQKLLQALNNRSAALYELARFDEAEEAARQAMEIYPDVAALHVNLANALLQRSQAQDAAREYRRALELDPQSAEAQIGLSTVLGESKRLAAALEFIEHTIAVKGENAQRLAALASAQQAKGDWEAAEATSRKLLDLQPNNIGALTTLASCLGNRGDHRGAIALQEQALALQPGMSAVYSNIAFAATYVPDLTQEELFAYHEEWGKRFEKPVAPCTEIAAFDRTADRPLRIGYVSGDFGTHPVGFLIRDVLPNHDRDRFHVTCYSMMRASDPVTEAIRASADEWVEALFMSDEALTQRILDDRIDILVDLSGHTAYNRLPVFARKPAPVQASWIGYFHSTGLRRIDYFITDPHTTPADTRQVFSETPVWLPHTRFCYAPPAYAPGVAPTPALAGEGITFGTFNRIDKLVDPVIAAWVRILNRLPASRLLLKAGSLENDSTCEALTRRFEAAGLDRSRLELRGPSPHPEMLAEYADIDIALDPFPFNGGMTTLEALWMGVPVVTLAGESVVGRQSTAALANLDLRALVFDDVDAYVDGAVALASDIDRLSALRASLRDRMARSPICQPARFTHDLETLYRAMWQAWCRGEKLGTAVQQSGPLSLRRVLHVGCGPTDIRSLPPLFQRRWQEIRLDIDPGVRPDVVATMLDMAPVESESVDAVYSSHNLEHLHPHEVEVALREFRRVLKPDGFLLLTCPDLQAVCRLVADDKLEDAAYVSPAGPIAPIDMLYGHRPAMAKGNLYMAHNTGFTARTLQRAMEEAGFGSVTVEPRSGFALWALAYQGRAEPQRIAADKAAGFP